MPDLFVSHATKDDAHADRFADALLTHGITTWIDHRGGIEPGAPNWDRALREAIKTCDAGVLLMTPRSLASDICEAECLFVREQGKPLYVAFLEAGGEVWLSIKMIQYADLRTDFERGVALLGRALRGETDAALPTPVRGKITGVDTLRVTLPYLMAVPLSGRDDDLATLRAGLGSPPDPHVTQIIAVGGTGKSRVAAELALNHPNGAIWHRCTKASEAYEVTELIRRHYGLDEKAPPEHVLGALDGAAPLIVIDNAEDVDPGTERRAAYAELATRIATRGVPVVLAARAAWNELKPLRPHDLIPLTVEPAVRIALGFAAAEGLELTEDKARELAIAGRLHPRLIEFAVRQLHERGFERVKRQLQDLEQADVQEALDEMIYKTVRQMAEQARDGAGAEQVLRHLTVFESPFDWDAAMALKPMDLNENTLDDALVTLQRWGFVRFDKASERYAIDEVVRGALPPDEACHARHFEYYFALYGDYDANMDEDRHTAIARDWVELRAVLLWGNHQQPRNAAVLAFALNYYMHLHLPRVEWGSVIENAYEAANRIDDQMGQANTLRALGDVAFVQNDYAPARNYYERALALYQRIGARFGQANTLQALGGVARTENAFELACSYYDRALSLHEQIDDWLGQANTLKAIGDIALARNADERARSLYNQALTLYKQINDRFGQANTLSALGDIARRRNAYEQARILYYQALTIYERIGTRLGQANILLALGDVAYILDEDEQARRLYHKALTLYKQIDDRFGQASTLQALGDMARMRNEFDMARSLYHQALTLHEQIVNELGQANALKGLGDVARMQQCYELARNLYNRALSLYERIGARLGHAHTLKAMGDVEHKQNAYESALTFYEQALTFYKHIGDWLGQANALQSLGDVAHENHLYDSARTYYEQALALGEATGDLAARLNALGNLGLLENAMGNRSAACEALRRALCLADSHAFFKTHPAVQTWRGEYAMLGCDGELEAPTQND